MFAAGCAECSRCLHRWRAVQPVPHLVSPLECPRCLSMAGIFFRSHGHHHTESAAREVAAALTVRPAGMLKRLVHTVREMRRGSR